MGFAQPDQVVPAVGARTNAHVVGIQRRAGLLDQRPRQRRVVAADEHHPVATFGQVMRKCIRQGVGKTLSGLFQQMRLSRQQRG